MCGRIAQTLSPADYAAAAGWPTNPQYKLPLEPLSHFNGSPGAAHFMFRSDNGLTSGEAVMWQYLSSFAKLKGLRPAINARAEKLLDRYYITLTRTGRTIVPVDAWYEWTGPDKDKTRWLIRPKNKMPIYLAALTNHHPGKEDPEKAGFVLATDDAAGGLVDVHDRRPIALTAEDALTWMDLATPAPDAVHIARTMALGTADFEWYPVASKSQADRSLFEPIGDIVSG